MDPATRDYFNGFGSLLGAGPLSQHLTSLPRWWTLRDERGRTGLMWAMACRGATPELLELPHARELAAAVDHDGHTLWYHLFRHSYRRVAKDVEPWFEALGEVPHTQSTPARGWMIQRVMDDPTRAFAGQAPLQRGGRSAWLDLGYSEDPGLWWRCDEAEAKAYLAWQLDVGACHPRQALELDGFVLHTLGLGRGQDRPDLPADLRQALGVVALMAGGKAGLAFMEKRLDEGGHVDLPPRGLDAVRQALDDGMSAWESPRIRVLLARNQAARMEARAALDAGADAATATARVRL